MRPARITRLLKFAAFIAILIGSFSTTASAQSSSLEGYWDLRFGPEDIGGMGLRSQARTIAVHPISGDVYVGGTFISAGEISTVRIARWDGTNWHPVGDGTGGRVNALAFAPDGMLYVGGEFPWVAQSDGSRIDARNIARWDGTSWSKVGLGVTERVYSLAYDQASGKLYAGGSFKEAVNADSSSAGSTGIAYWDGDRWNPVGQGVKPIGIRVDAIAVDPTSGDIAIGGFFVNVVINTDGTELVTGGLAIWDGSSWSKPDQVPPRINVLRYDSNGRLLAGGDFVAIGDLEVGGLARLDEGEWESIGGHVPAGGVNTILPTADGLFIGGTFVELIHDDGTVVPAQRIAYFGFDTGEWRRLGDGVRRSHTPSVLALAGDDNRIYVGGIMESAGGVPTENFGIWHRGEHLFATSPVRFSVDTRSAELYGLVRKAWEPRPMLQILSGELAGRYYTFDDNDDGVHSITIDQPAGETVEYVFAVDRSGDAIERNDTVFELDAPATTRKLFVPTIGQSIDAPIALFDNRNLPGPDANALEYDSGWIFEGSNPTFLTASHVHKLRLRAEELDRTLYVGVWQTDDDPGGITPSEILQVAPELIWAFETYPAVADYKMKVEWDYSEITGIADPNGLTLLYRNHPDSVWMIVPTEVDLNDEELHTPAVERLAGQWTIGSFTADNVLTNRLPGIAANPRPEDGVLAAPIRPNLRWDLVDEASTYDVYVWPANEPQPDNPTDQLLSDASATVGPLMDGVEYNWRIVSNNINGSTDSPVWSFTVGDTPDLVVGSVQAPTEAFSGQQVTIDWTVMNVDKGSTNVPRWYDTAYLSSSTEFDPKTDFRLGSTQNVSVLASQEEYGNQTTFTLPHGIQGPFYVLMITDRSPKNVGLLDEADESNNVTASDPINITLEPYANLGVTDVIAPDLVFSGDSIDVTWTVSNDGTGQTDKDRWFDTIFISEDSVFNFNFVPGTLINIHETTLASFEHVGALEIGESYTITHRLKLPDDTIGDHYLFVYADNRGGSKQPEGGVVYEFNQELDNWTPEAISVTLTPPPDLRVTSVIGPAEALSGQSVAVEWTVTNLGAGATTGDEWLDLVYHSRSSSFDSLAVTVLGAFRHVGGLKNDSSYTTTKEVRLPDGIEGESFFFVRTDVESEIFEHTFETNNTSVSAQSTSVDRAPYPDLATTNVTLSTSESVAGQQIVVNYDLLNAGTRSTIGSWTDSIYVLDQPVWDPLLAVPIAGSKRSEPIGAGDKRAISTALAVPPDLDGEYYVFVLADAGKQVFEYPDLPSDIGKSNVLSVSGYPPVDLRATFVQVPPTANSSDTLAAKIRITNTGTAKTLPNGWRDVVYLSEDDVLDVDSDQPIASIEHEGKLSGGSNYEANVDVVIPQGLSGEYFLIVQTDGENIVAEIDEANNFEASGISISLTDPVDLVVSALDVPNAFSAGDRVEVSWTVTNEGAGRTQGRRWFDSVYLLKGQIAGRAALPLGRVERIGAVDGGESYDSSLEFTVPAFAAGPYNLTVVTDVRNDIYEHLADGNNLKREVVELSLPLPSDLVVTDVIGSAVARPGEEIEVTWTVMNAGSNPARGYSRDVVFVSPDVEWDVSDPVVGVFERAIDLSPGASGKASGLVDVGRTYELDAQANITGDLPSLVPGSYHLIVRADAGNSIRETDESNNIEGSDSEIDVSIPQLMIGVPETFDLEVGRSKMYRVDVGPNEDLRFTLESNIERAGNEVYVAYGRAPTIGGNFDFASAEPGVADHELVVPGTEEGTYYVLVVARSSFEAAAQQATLAAESLEFSVTSIVPPQAGQGQVSSTLNGAGFRTEDSVFLRSSSGLSVPAGSKELVNSTTVRVRFDLDQVEVGDYDVVVERENGDAVILEDGFKVLEASRLRTTIEILGPDQIRGEGTAEYKIVVANTSNVDIPYLLVQVASTRTRGVKLDTELISLAEIGGQAAGGPVFIRSTDGLTVIPLVGRDLGPDQAAVIQLSLSDFLRSIVNVSVNVLALDKDSFIDEILESSEYTRVRLKEDATPGTPDAAFLNDQNAFLDATFSHFVNVELIDEVPSTGKSSRNLASSDRAHLVIAGKTGATSQTGSCTYDLADDTYDCPSIPNPKCRDAFNDCLSKQQDACAERGVLVCGAAAWGGAPLGAACAFAYVSVCSTRDNGFSTPQELCAPVKYSCDPNDILGPDGYSDQKWVGARQSLPYTIRFENDSERATASAQVVGITHPLDPDTDERTFRLGSFGFGSHTFDPPENVSFYRERLDVTDSLGVMVDVSAGIDVTSNRAFWRFTTIDPKSGDQPVNDPDLGFLPINDEAGSGEGFVSYTIKANEDAETGAKIDALAEIVFDLNAPIETPSIFNTLDATPPISTMNVLSFRQDTAAFDLTWSGTDFGSGIRSFSLYVSENDGPFNVLDIANEDTSTIFIGTFGSRYRFFTIATDNTGNVEPFKTDPDASTVVSTEEDNPSGIPTEFALHQNYPNPFNPTTTIPFDLPENGAVELVVYDVTGRLVLKVDKGLLTPGHYQHSLQMSQYASGVYLYQLRVTDQNSLRFMDVGKFVLVK